MQLKQIFPFASDFDLQKVAADLNVDLEKFGLGTVLRRAHFFAQVLEEGGPELEAKEENLNYSPEVLKAKFRYYSEHPNEAVTDGYERHAKTNKYIRKANQEAIAKKAYANRNGNGDAASGDGWKYRGRGLFQVTGRSNYAAVTRQYRILYPGQAVDFEDNPDLMAVFPYAIRSAVCFWTSHGLHKLADMGDQGADVDRVTKVINKHTDSYGKRRDHFKEAIHAFE